MGHVSSTSALREDIEGLRKLRRGDAHGGTHRQHEGAAAGGEEGLLRAMPEFEEERRTKRL